MRNSSAARVDPCPPAPTVIPAHAARVSRTQRAVRETTAALGRTDPATPAYRRLAAEYEQRLTAAMADRERLGAETRAFGAYLRANGVRPEHIVICLRIALEAARRAAGGKVADGGSGAGGRVTDRTGEGERRVPGPQEPSAPTDDALARDLVTWCIKGYYDGA